MSDSPRCPDCGGLRLLSWRAYVEMPDDEVICPHAPLGRWFHDLGVGWDEAGVSPPR